MALEASSSWSQIWRAVSESANHWSRVMRGDGAEEALPGRFSVVTSPLVEIVPEQAAIDLSGAQALLVAQQDIHFLRLSG